MRLLHGARHDIERIQPVVPAAVGNGTRREAQAQDVEAFFDPLAACFHRHAEHRVFARRKSAPDADLEPAAGQDVKGGQTLRDVHRVMQRQRNNRMIQTDVARALGRRREHEFGLGRVRVAAHEVVFDQPRAAIT